MKRNLVSMAALFMMMLLFSVSTTSCSDDDDEVGEKSDLIGTWVLTQAEGYEIYNGNKEEYNDSYKVEDKEDVYEIKEDGTCINYDKENNYRTTGSWKKDGDYLVVSATYDFNGDGKEETETEKAKILKLNATTLVLEYAEDDWYEKTTYTKIK